MERDLLEIFLVYGAIELVIIEVYVKLEARSFMFLWWI